MSASTAAVSPFEAPAHLTDAERRVWLRQAPLAFQQGTLTRAHALAFERYCAGVVLEQEMAAGAERGGTNHRGLLQRLNTLELQFLLAPCGKASPEGALPAEAPADPLRRFTAPRGT